MAKDTSLPLRQAVITTLRTDSDLTALVPSERVYGMSTPATTEWPFSRYGSPDSLPFRGQCIDGATITFSVHSFSKAEFEDECAQINAAVSAALDRKTLELDSPVGAKAHVTWRGSQIVPDPTEASAWHGINRFEATIAS